MLPKERVRGEMFGSRGIRLQVRSMLLADHFSWKPKPIYLVVGEFLVSEVEGEVSDVLTELGYCRFRSLRCENLAELADALVWVRSAGQYLRSDSYFHLRLENTPVRPMPQSKTVRAKKSGPDYCDSPIIISLTEVTAETVATVSKTFRNGQTVIKISPSPDVTEDFLRTRLPFGCHSMSGGEQLAVVRLLSHNFAGETSLVLGETGRLTNLISGRRISTKTANQLFQHAVDTKAWNLRTLTFWSAIRNLTRGLQIVGESSGQSAGRTPSQVLLIWLGNLTRSPILSQALTKWFGQRDASQLARTAVSVRTLMAATDTEQLGSDLSTNALQLLVRSLRRLPNSQQSLGLSLNSWVVGAAHRSGDS